jgi:hypothetical protein
LDSSAMRARRRAGQLLDSLARGRREVYCWRLFLEALLRLLREVWTLRGFSSGLRQFRASGGEGLRFCCDSPELYAAVEGDLCAAGSSGLVRSGIAAKKTGSPGLQGGVDLCLAVSLVLVLWCEFSRSQVPSRHRRHRRVPAWARTLSRGAVLGQLSFKYSCHCPAPLNTLLDVPNPEQRFLVRAPFSSLSCSLCWSLVSPSGSWAVASRAGGFRAAAAVELHLTRVSLVPGLQNCC